MKSKYNTKFLILVILVAVMIISCNNNNLDDDINNNEQSNEENIIPEPKEPMPATVCYTANESGSIAVINLETNKVVSSIKTDGATNSVQVSKDGGILAATVSYNGENGKVMFYDTSNNELINQVEVGKSPMYVDFTNNGKYAIVSNYGDNNVSIIDMNNYKVINTIETGTGPNGLSITRDDTLAFVANMGEDSFSIISLVNFSNLNKKVIGKAPVSTAIAPDGIALLTTLKDEDSLAIYSMSKGTIDKITVGKGPTNLYIQADGRYAFVANEGSEESPSNSVSKINLLTNTVEATIEVGKGAYGIAISHDNKYVYVTNRYDDTVSVIDNENNKVIETIPVDKNPKGIALK